MSKDDCRMMSKDNRYARNTESGCNWLLLIFFSFKWSFRDVCIGDITVF